MSRTVFITGGARGIGAACCEVFASRGWNVVVADRDVEGAESQAAALGAHALGLGVDVADEASVAHGVAVAADHFGGLHAVVTAAGIIDPAPTSEVSLDRWRRLLAVNLDGTFLTAQHAQPHLAAAGGGAMVMISSVNAHLGMARRASYAASKGAVESLVRTLANEWAPDGIRVNAVAPGYIRTDLVEAAIRAGTVDIEAVERAIPQGRLGSPVELARVVAFLADDAESSFVTGQTLIADGGMLASGSSW